MNKTIAELQDDVRKARGKAYQAGLSLSHGFSDNDKYAKAVGDLFRADKALYEVMKESQENNNE